MSHHPDATRTPKPPATPRPNRPHAEILRSATSARTHPEEILVYTALDVFPRDIALATWVVRWAKTNKVGTSIGF